MIESKSHRQRQGFNFFSPLPPLAYDIEDNPLFRRLKEKADQLSGIPQEALKVIFVADGGSMLLRRLHQRDHLKGFKSGMEIIKHFLTKASVDAVCVFSPFRTRSFLARSDRLRWQVSLLCPNARSVREDKLEKLTEILPEPRFEGYQARSLHKQGLFTASARGWYLESEITIGGSLTVKISARLLQEYLAGKISLEEFQRFACGDVNYFRDCLERGYTITNAKFENAGIDEDDDHVVFEFMPDPAASSLK